MVYVISPSSIPLSAIQRQKASKRRHFRIITRPGDIIRKSTVEPTAGTHTQEMPGNRSNQYLLLLYHHLNPLAIFTFTIFANYQEHHTKIHKDTLLSHHHSKIFSSPYHSSISLRKFSESCQIICRILNPFHRPVAIPKYVLWLSI